MRTPWTVLLLLVACAGSAGDSSQPAAPPTYPPAMTKGETVDDDGKPLDPEVASCLADKQNLDARVWSGATGLGAAALGTETPSEGSSVDTTESDFATCWCKSRGFRGLRRNGACLE